METKCLNNGELAMYLIENAHEPIIDLVSFERVQETKGKRQKERVDKIGFIPYTVNGINPIF